MKYVLTLTSLLVLTALAEPAQANLVVDPTAAALGSSSVFEPVELERQTPMEPEVRDLPAHWRGVRSSDVYLVRREDHSGASFEPSLSPLALRPLVSGSGTLEVAKYGSRTDPSWNEVRLRDPRRQWLGLDLRQPRGPVVIVPIGGTQPHTPTTPAPEPATVMLLASGLGAVGAAGYARRRQAWHA